MIVTLMLATTVATAIPNCPSPEEWRTDKSVRMSKAERDQTYRRIDTYLRRQGVPKEARAVALLTVWRESRGDSCSSHDGGTGSGPLGMKHRFYGKRSELVIPEVAARRLLRSWRRARDRYKAKTWLRWGQIYGGRIRPEDQEIGKDAAFCRLLARKEIDCESPLRLGRAA